MIKNPAYILSLSGLYIFSFGYIYEWGYLSEFNVEYLILNHTYAEFLVLATHALTIAITSSNGIFYIFVTFLIVSILYSVQRNSLYKKWVQSLQSQQTEMGRVLLRITLITLSPLFIIVILLLPFYLGYSEAKELKISSNVSWQEIEVEGDPPVKYVGVTIRIISGGILFYQKDDPITHFISDGKVLAIRHRTTLHDDNIQLAPRGDD